MADYRDTLDPHADSKAQQRQIRALTGMEVTVDTGTSYTYTLTDANGYKRHNNAGAIEATVPPASSVPFPIGTKLTIEQMGAGQVSVAGGSGVTINYPATLSLALSEQWSVGYLTKVSIDEWTIAGGLAEAEGGTPAWLPEGAIAFLDFVNGNYYADGAEQVVTDLIGQDASEGYDPFNFENIVEGVGLKGDISGTSNPIFTPIISDFMVSTGGTVVFDFSVEEDAYLEVDLLDLPAFEGLQQLVLYAEEGQTYMKDVATVQTFLPDIAAGAHKAAYTVTPAKMAASVDGNATIAATPATPGIPFNTFAFSMVVEAEVVFNVVRSVTIYPPQADGALPALSA